MGFLSPFIRRAGVLAAAVIPTVSYHRAENHYVWVRPTFCMRRGDLFPLASDGLQPITLPDFREIMGLHPDISRAITRHVQNRNSWVVATIMQNHDEGDRDAITEGVLDQFP